MSTSCSTKSKIMRRQWPCSKCGFACSSTWRSLHPARPVICNTCKLNEKNKIIVHNSTDAARIGPSQNSSFDDHCQIISPPIMQKNMTFTVSQIGMIFGNLPLEPLAIPVMVLGDQSASQEQKLKPKVVVKEEHCELGLHDHFYCGSTSLKASTSILESGKMIEIKQEYDCQETLSLSIWDPNKVQKKRRSKLPQYTPSPLARLTKQLHHVYHHSNISKTSLVNRAACDHQNRAPKYDDVLIYEKCKHVADNEIGLGGKLLSPQVNSSRKMGLFYKPRCSCGYTTTSSCTSDQSGAYSNFLIDVPITSNPSE